MIIYKDVIGNGELFSNQQPKTTEYDDTIYKVQSKYVAANQFGDVDVGCGNAFGGGEPEEDANAPAEAIPKVLDVLDSYELVQIQFSKKEFGAYIKRYLKKVVDYLENSGKKDRVEGFKKGSTDFAKFVMKNFDEMEFYFPKGADDLDSDEIDWACGIQYWEDESAAGPVFYFFKDGLKEEKC